MELNDLTCQIRGAIFRTHAALGPGLLESVYEAALRHELEREGMAVISQLGIPMVYKEIKLDLGFRLDLLVNETVIIELKSVEALADVHFKTLLTYLRLADKPLGILVNFNVISLEDKVSIKRVINSHK